MIFVTVGTHEQPFNRLIQKVDELKHDGSRKYSPMHYMKKLATVLKMEKYDVIHVNGNSSTMAMELVTAKLVGVPSRIAHVHTTRSKYPYANVVLHPIFATSYTTALAVSKQAGDWLYGKNYTLLNNAINTAKYKFNVDVREKMRKKYELTGKFVIGTVGKLNPPKNHIHLLQTFGRKKLHKKARHQRNHLRKKCKRQIFYKLILIHLSSFWLHALMQHTTPTDSSTSNRYIYPRQEQQSAASIQQKELQTAGLSAHRSFFFFHLISAAQTIKFNIV